MSEEPAQVLPTTAFPWESEVPLHQATGFVLSGGAVEIRPMYFVYTKAILLVATVRIGGLDPSIWRRHWTSYEGAVDAAERLVDDAFDYLTETLGLRPRDTEDLDIDDFVRHLHLRLNNGFN